MRSPRSSVEYLTGHTSPTCIPSGRKTTELSSIFRRKGNLSRSTFTSVVVNCGFKSGIQIERHHQSSQCNSQKNEYQGSFSVKWHVSQNQSESSSLLDWNGHKELTKCGVVHRWPFDSPTRIRHVRNIRKRNNASSDMGIGGMGNVVRWLTEGWI
jgi:hypothetical protein